MTSLPDRAHLHSVLERRAAASRRTARTFGIVLLDLDGAEDLATLGGETLLDDTIRALARRLRRRLEPSDLLARYDRHTLAVVLPVADAAGAAGVADTLSAAVSEAPLDTVDRLLAVTVSVGTAAHEPPEHGSETLLRAEEALCRAMAAWDTQATG